MEAASFNYARDRLNNSLSTGSSNSSSFTIPQLQKYIVNACDPRNFEPNLALNLEVCDLVNAKKGNAPREAAFAIVNLINHRNPNVSLLALCLLDICVKNCGYPFHLQISSKEFLNELVRRFPPRPPLHPSYPMQRILKCIAEWRVTLCETSRYKEDLGYIRDMHRLLASKGYLFPELRSEQLSTLNSTYTLQSPQEMEEEEREAQSAKLQELIRRATPRDLQEANSLVKILAGYDTRSKTDYRSKAAKEIVMLQQKAGLLNKMLDQFVSRDKFTPCDASEELVNALISAHPKVRKMCEEESDDHEAVARLLDLNDTIIKCVQRYRQMKNGGEMSDDSNHRPDTSGEISLIDLDESFGGHSDGGADAGGKCDFKGVGIGKGPSEIRLTETSDMSASGLEHDLLGLNIQSEEGRIETSSNRGKGTFTVNDSGRAISLLELDSSGLPAGCGSHMSTAVTQVTKDTIVHGEMCVEGLGYRKDMVAGFDKMNGIENTGNGVNFDATGDDEWQFTSALPNGDVESRIKVTGTNSPLEVIWKVKREKDSHTEIGKRWAVVIDSVISSRTKRTVRDLTFHVAVTKAFNLTMETQSSRILGGMVKNGITQQIRVWRIGGGNEGSGVRTRWRLTYTLSDETTGTSEEQSEQGEVTICV